jgi:hypothetical protein
MLFLFKNEGVVEETCDRCLDVDFLVSCRACTLIGIGSQNSDTALDVLWSGGRVGERGLASCKDFQLLVTKCEHACTMENGNGWRRLVSCTPSHLAPYILPLPAAPLAW